MPPIHPASAKSAKPATASTVQHHLQQAGEQLQQAETSRLAAAKAHGMGDTHEASHQAQAASDHTARALQHVSQAKKLAAPGSVAVARGPAEYLEDAMEAGAL